MNGNCRFEAQVPFDQDRFAAFHGSGAGRKSRAAVCCVNSFRIGSTWNFWPTVAWSLVGTT